MDGQGDGWKNKGTDRLRDGQMDQRTDGWIGGQANGSLGGWQMD